LSQEARFEVQNAPKNVWQSESAPDPQSQLEVGLGKERKKWRKERGNGAGTEQGRERNMEITVLSFYSYSTALYLCIVMHDINFVTLQV